METNSVWKGTVEKRGNDVIRRWMKRELIIYPNECLYFSLNDGELRGYIPFANSTKVFVEGDVVKIVTIGRAEKRTTERNGRSFEFRLTHPQERANFVSILNKTLNQYRSNHYDEINSKWNDSNEKELIMAPAEVSVDPTPVHRSPPIVPSKANLVGGVQGRISHFSGGNVKKKKLTMAAVRSAGSGPIDYDDEISVSSTASPEPAVQKADPKAAKLRKIHSYHDISEDEMLDISEAERASESASLQTAGAWGVTEESAGFFLCSNLYVEHLQAQDRAWVALCGKYSPSSKNPLLHIKSVPYRPPREGNGLAAVEVSVGDVDTIEDLYSAVIVAKPFFDSLIGSVAVKVSQSTSSTSGEISARSRVVSPHELVESLQLCGVYNFFAPSQAAVVSSPQPPYSSVLQTKILPEACMCNVISGKIVCHTPEQINAVVKLLSETGAVVFLDNRFTNPLGSPPERDNLVMPLEGAYYCGRYRREIRLVVEVQCTSNSNQTAPNESDSLSEKKTCTSYRCEIVVSLKGLDDVGDAVLRSDEEILESSQGVHKEGPGFEVLLRNYFLQFRSWCVNREDLGLVGEGGPSVVQLYYSRDTQNRIDLLRRISSLSPDDYRQEGECFMQSINSQAFEDNPTTYSDGGYFMGLMQEVCQSGDIVLMRALCSLFREMGLLAGCVAVQRRLLRLQVNSSGGEVAMSVSLENLSCALLQEGTVDGITEGIATSEESLTMREGFHVAANSTPGYFSSYRDITSLLDITLLHARIHYDAGDVQEAQSILTKALSFGAEGSGRGLSIVKHHFGLFQVTDGSYDQGISNLEAVLKDYKKYFGSRHPLVAGVMLDLCRAHTQAGHYEIAERIGKNGLSIQADCCGMNHLAVAGAFVLVAPVLNLLGKAGDSKAYIEKAVKIRKDYFGWLHSSVAECLLHYGVICRLMGSVSASNNYIDVALEILETKLSNKKISLNVSRVMRRVASAMILQNQLDVARRLMECVMKCQKGRHMVINEGSEVAKDMSELCLRMGDVEEAEKYARDSISEGTFSGSSSVGAVKGGALSQSTTTSHSPPPLPPVVKRQSKTRQFAESSLIMSRVFQAKQRYEDAMEWNEKALRTAQAQRGTVHSSVATIKMDMADILVNTGRVEEAVGVLYDVVALQREIHEGADSMDLVMAMYRLATGLMAMQLFCEAKAMLLNALDTALRLNNDDPEIEIVAMIYHELANCCQLLDVNDPEAEAYGQKAISLAENVFGQNDSVTVLYKTQWGGS